MYSRATALGYKRLKYLRCVIVAWIMLWLLLLLSGWKVVKAGKQWHTSSIKSYKDRPWKKSPLGCFLAAADTASHTTVSAPMASVLSLDCILAWNEGMDVWTAAERKTKRQCLLYNKVHSTDLILLPWYLEYVYCFKAQCIVLFLSFSCV